MALCRSRRATWAAEIITTSIRIDGPNGPLYRIYHDSVGEGGYERSEAVAVVLESYGELLEYRL
jgi:hypothetical protein